jgi:flagellum-specific peptidoglycan hydrolase FlgJ
MAPAYRLIAVAALGVTVGLTATFGPATAAAAAPRKKALTAEQRAFLDTATAAARSSQQRYGVPASVVIAQTVLETGWGTSELARSSRNYFGMTCGPAGPGPVAADCRDGRDRVCTRSGCRATISSFRVYRSMADSFADHGRVMSTNPRYSRAFAARSNPEAFAKRMARAGYATDPRYAQRLIKIIKKYQLRRHDRR